MFSLLYSLSIKSTVIDVILTIGEGIRDFFSWIIGFLPDDPINLNDTIFNIPQPIENALAFVNWFLPLADMLILLGAWITLILGIWFVRALMKLAHFI